jgi:uncharacterized caspase-like protein
LARQTPAEKAAAKEKKAARWRDDRVYLRSHDPDFVEREKAATAKSNAFTKAAKMFARANMALFEQWQKLTGTQGVSASPAGQPQRMVPTPDQPTDQHEAIPSAGQRLRTYKSLGGQIPTAQSLEESRYAPAALNVLSQLGHAMRVENDAPPPPQKPTPYLLPSSIAPAPNKQQQDRQQEELLRRLLG